MVYKVNVVFTEDEHGYYVYCPELPGCHSQGDSFEDAKTNIREALDLYLETMTQEEIADSLNKEIVTTTMEVKVAWIAGINSSGQQAIKIWISATASH